MLQYLNSIHPNIQFTLEIMKNKQLNFLDLSIKIMQDRLEFTIYRKNTTTDLMINYNSNHPKSQKFAAIHSYAHRAVNIPMTKTAMEEEFNIIKQTAANNGYPMHIVINIIKKHLRKRDHPQPIKPQNNPKYVSLTYYNSHSNRVASIFKKHGYTPAFKTSNTLDQILKQKTTKDPPQKYN